MFTSSFQEKLAGITMCFLPKHLVWRIQWIEQVIFTSSERTFPKVAKNAEKNQKMTWSWLCHNTHSVEFPQICFAHSRSVAVTCVVVQIWQGQTYRQVQKFQKARMLSASVDGCFCVSPKQQHWCLSWLQKMLFMHMQSPSIHKNDRGYLARSVSLGWVLPDW